MEVWKVLPKSKCHKFDKNDLQLILPNGQNVIVPLSFVFFWSTNLVSTERPTDWLINVVLGQKFIQLEGPLPISTFLLFGCFLPASLVGLVAESPVGSKGLLLYMYLFDSESNIKNKDYQYIYIYINNCTS